MNHENRDSFQRMIARARVQSASPDEARARAEALRGAALALGTGPRRMTREWVVEQLNAFADVMEAAVTILERDAAERAR